MNICGRDEAMSVKRTLGEKLRELREDYDLSQSQVAMALSIDRSTYTNYELNKTQPNLETVVRLSRIFDVNVEDLMPDLDEDEAGGARHKQPMRSIDKSLNKEERGMITRFRAMDRGLKDEWLRAMDNIAKRKRG